MQFISPWLRYAVIFLFLKYLLSGILTPAFLAASSINMYRQGVLWAVGWRTENPATLHHSVLRAKMFLLLLSFLFICTKKKNCTPKAITQSDECFHLMWLRQPANLNWLLLHANQPYTLPPAETESYYIYLCIKKQIIISHYDWMADIETEQPANSR